MSALAVSKQTLKKTADIALRVVTILVVLFAVAMVIFTLVTVNTVGRENATLFGSRLYIVETNSMQGVFSAGDIIVVRAVDGAEGLEPGTVITYTSSAAESYSDTITHCIREQTQVDGKPAYITYGVASGSDDPVPVLAENVVGIYQFRLPGAGYFFSFMRTPWGYVLIVLLPFLILLGLSGANLYKLVRAYKKEKAAETAAAQTALEEERARAAADRAEAERLREELRLLKEQQGNEPPDELPVETTENAAETASNEETADKTEQADAADESDGET